MKKLVQHLNTCITSTSHTLIINDDQVDLFYLFEALELQVYVNGSLIYSRNFQPGRVALNYINVIDVAIQIYTSYKKKINHSVIC